MLNKEENDHDESTSSEDDNLCFFHPQENVPRCSLFIWAISCRPVSHMRNFSPHTLMYQPDTRLFCHKGNSCTVPNETHHAMYCHDIPNKTSGIISPENPHGVPGIKHTWTLNGNVFENPCIADTIPKNSRVVLYIHGHSTRYYKFTSVLSHLDTIYNPSKETREHDDNSRDCVYTVGFLWPCHKKKFSYARARAKASSEGADRLRRCIEALHQRGNKICIVAHSLGARLILSALHLPDSRPIDGDAAGESESVHAVLLIGAALHSDALAVEFPRRLLRTSRIVNFHSSRDSVLAEGFQWAEFFTRLSVLNFSSSSTAGVMGGRDGVAEAQVMGCEDCDVSAEVGTHSVHAYLESPTFKQTLCQIVSSMLV